jgi:hypothetical protein
MSGLTSTLLSKAGQAFSSGLFRTVPTGLPPICSAVALPAAMADATEACEPVILSTMP